MEPVLLIKPGVTFKPTWACARLIDALKATAKQLGLVLTITAGSDSHPPTDVHTIGEALDVRTHDLAPEQKQNVLYELMRQLQHGPMDAPIKTSSGLATSRFFAWIENPGQPDEHLHAQRRHGTVYSVLVYLAA